MKILKRLRGIVLICCLALISISGYFLVNTVTALAACTVTVTCPAGSAKKSITCSGSSCWADARSCTSDTGWKTCDGRIGVIEE